MNRKGKFLPTAERVLQNGSKNQVEKARLEEKIRVMEEKVEAPVKTYVDELIEGDVFEEPDVFFDKIEEEDENSKEGKKNLDLFHKMYPEY